MSIGLRGEILCRFEFYRTAIKAYIEGPSRTSNEVRSFRIEFNEGGTDGIRLVPVEDEADTMNGRSEADGLYNMAGQRLSSPVEGINIIHGKKVFVK